MFNLTFLNSIFLVGLAAGIIPILIHLFSRHKLPKIEFSSLRLLKELQRKKLRKVKLKQWLLLLLRILIILLLALAFARPTLKSFLSSNISAHTKSTVVFIIDNSYSMNYATRDASLLDLAKEKALSLANLLEEGDDALLLTMNEKPTIYFDNPTHNFDLLKESIENIQPSFATSDVMIAMENMIELLNKSKNPNKEIYLISDFQSLDWEKIEMDKFKNLLPSNTSLYFISLHNETLENIYVHNLQYGSQLLETDRPIRIRAQITNGGEIAVSNIRIQLYIDDKGRGENIINLEPNETKTITFSATFKKSGIHKGYIEIEDDPLLDDNKVYFSLPIAGKIKVAIIDGYDIKENKISPALFLKVAMNPQQGVTSLLEPDIISHKDFNKIELNDYEVIVLANVNSLEANDLMRLQEFQRKGGGIAIFIGTNSDLRYYNNTLLPSICPVTLRNVLGESDKQKSHFSLKEIDYNHTIFQPFQNKKQGDFTTIRFFRLVSANAKPGTNVLARFANKNPAIIEAQKGDGRCLLWTSSFDLEWSDMPLKSLFVPLLHKMMCYLGAFDQSNTKTYLVHQEIIEEVEQIPYGKQIIGLAPDGTESYLQPEQRQNSVVLRYTDTIMPGFYKLLLDDKILNTFAINPNPIEANLKHLDEKDLKKYFDSSRVYYVKNDDILEDKVLQVRYGRELWKTFLAIVLVFMVFEMILARGRKDMMN